MAANTITLKKPPTDSVEFEVHYSSTDVSAAESLLAAVSGKCHYIEEVMIFCASAITVWIGSGETTPGSIDDTYIGPLPFAATSSQYHIKYDERALVVAVGTPITIDASGGGNIFVIIRGKTGPAF